MSQRNPVRGPGSNQHKDQPPVAAREATATVDAAAPDLTADPLADASWDEAQVDAVVLKAIDPSVYSFDKNFSPQKYLDQEKEAAARIETPEEGARSFGVSMGVSVKADSALFSEMRDAGIEVENRLAHEGEAPLVSDEDLIEGLKAHPSSKAMGRYSAPQAGRPPTFVVDAVLMVRGNEAADRVVRALHHAEDWGGERQVFRNEQNPDVVDAVYMFFD